MILRAKLVLPMSSPAIADGAVVVPFALIDRVIARTAEIRRAEAAFEAKVKAGLCVPDFIKALYDGGRVRETD